MNKAEKTGEKQGGNTDKMWPRWVEHQHPVEKKRDPAGTRSSLTVMDIQYRNCKYIQTSLLLTLDEISVRYFKFLIPQR